MLKQLNLVLHDLEKPIKGKHFYKNSDNKRQFLKIPCIQWCKRTYKACF